MGPRLNYEVVSAELFVQILLVHILHGYHHMNSTEVVVHCLQHLIVQEVHYCLLSPEV